MPKLVIFRGDAVENEIRLAGSTVRIGRHTRNDVVLDDSANGVSRFHAEIRTEGGTYFIVDLNSRNGIWINGRRIKDKAALALGVPVTLGAYELTLEDDVSTGQFDDEAAAINQPTIVNPAALEPRDAASGSGTRPPRAARSTLTAEQRQMLLWSGASVAVVLICVITFFVIRYRHRPPPTPPDVVVQQQTPPPTSVPQVAPTPDPKKVQIDQHLVDARAQLDASDYAGAISDHLNPALELDPENAEAKEMKQQAEEALARAATPPKPPRVVVKPEIPAEVETPGILRKPNETYADYSARVGRIKTNFDQGNRYLERQDYANAIARFRLVERDQPKYLGVDLSITETVAKQQKELDTAIDNGQRNEAAAKLRDALGWYQRALEIDPASSNARDKVTGLTERLTKSGLEAYESGEVRRKRGEMAKAIELYKQAVELLPRGHEKSKDAQRWLETLKP